MKLVVRPVSRRRVRERMFSPVFVGAVVGLSLIIFWNMLATYEGGEFIEFNTTEPEGNATSVLILEDTLWIDLGKYHLYGFLLI